jgi:hypothetical protein
MTTAVLLMAHGTPASIERDPRRHVAGVCPHAGVVDRGAHLVMVIRRLKGLRDGPSARPSSLVARLFVAFEPFVVEYV